MDIKCPRCGRLVTKKISNYKYKESGLDNLYLVGITVFECSCGVSVPSIFKTPHLHNLIAEALLKKPALLSGKEIRFLRKTLFLPANTFASTLGVGKTTLSKWENGLQRQSEAFDRLIRATYLIAKGFKKIDQIKTLKLLEKVELRKSEISYVLIAEKIGNDYTVNLNPIAGGQTERGFLVKMFTTPWTATTHGFTIEQIQMIPRLEIDYTSILKAKTRRTFVLQESA